MARRMFSPEIVESEDFLSLPISSQALYFHLAMNADDDGFIQPKKVMRMVGSSEDDLKVLLAKRFLLAFDGGVVVIKHWLIHNLIRGDRYKETRFIEEKKLLRIKENKAYTEIDNVGCQIGNQCPPQVRLGKVRIGKDNISANADAPFSLKEEIKKLEENPRREMNIIALYFEHRKPDLQTREQYSQALKRHLKSAIALKPFNDNQILKALDYCKKEYKDIYTLETLLKIITK